MNLREIEVFQAIMQARSVSGAAQLLSISQPSVSRVLRHMEDKLRVELFARKPHGLVPTFEAIQLAREVDKVYAGVRNVQALASDLMFIRTGKLRIASTHGISISILPAVMAEFRKLYPSVMTSLDILEYGEVTASVARGQHDVGLLLIRPQHPGVESECLTHSPFVCLCPGDHPLAAQETVSIEEALAYPLVVYNVDTPLGQSVRDEIERTDLMLEVACEVRIGWLAKALVAEGIGVAIGDALTFCVKPGEDVVTRPLRPAKALEVHLLRSREVPLSQAAESFLKLLRKSCR